MGLRSQGGWAEQGKGETKSNDMEICQPGSLILGSQQPWDPSIRLEPYTFFILASSGTWPQGLPFLVEPLQGTALRATRL